MREFRFYAKEESYGKTWWIDLPAYTAQGGDPAELQMVAGADDMLELLSEDSNEIRLQISEQKVKDFYELKRVDEIPTISGRYYFDNATDLLLWLCPVTLWIFEGRYPEIIYYKLCDVIHKQNESNEMDPGPNNCPPLGSISYPIDSSTGGLEDIQAAIFIAPNI